MQVKTINNSLLNIVTAAQSRNGMIYAFLPAAAEAVMECIIVFLNPQDGHSTTTWSSRDKTTTNMIRRTSELTLLQVRNDFGSC